MFHCNSKSISWKKIEHAFGEQLVDRVRIKRGGRSTCTVDVFPKTKIDPAQTGFPLLFTQQRYFLSLESLPSFPSHISPPRYARNLDIFLPIRFLAIFLVKLFCLYFAIEFRAQLVKTDGPASASWFVFEAYSVFDHLFTQRSDLLANLATSLTE